MGSKILPTCWTGHGKKVRLNDLEGDEWDELACFKWNTRGLNPRVFRDERTSWGLRGCLKQMGAIDRDVLKFTVERIKTERNRRKRAQADLPHSNQQPNQPLMSVPKHDTNMLEHTLLLDYCLRL